MTADRAGPGQILIKAEREFNLLSHLVRHGIPCSEPLSWSHGKRDPHGRIELLVTLEVAGATALDKLLQRPGTVTDLGPLLRSLAAHARCGRVARRHGATPGFPIIDMSYSHVFPQGIAGTRMATFDLQDLMFRIKHYFPAQRCRA